MFPARHSRQELETCPDSLQNWIRTHGSYRQRPGVFPQIRYPAGMEVWGGLSVGSLLRNEEWKDAGPGGGC
jgi:hypothetical protein